MKRIIAALFNSASGLKHGFLHETAIREEIIAFAIAIPAALVLTRDPWQLLLLWAVIGLVLIAELLNTGIEQVANRVTRERDPEIKFAKDCGSAAVLIALVIAAGVWGLMLLGTLGIL